MYGSMSNSQFMQSSQILAIQPIINGIQGPKLIEDYSFPLKTFKTEHPIQISSGQQSEIVIKFLAQNPGPVTLLTNNSNVQAFCDTYLQQISQEVFQCTIRVTGQFQGVGSTQIQIQANYKTSCYVILNYDIVQQNSLHLSQSHNCPPANQLILPVSTSIANNSMGLNQSYISSPMQASYFGTQSYYQQNTPVVKNSGRHHSPYCYGADIPDHVIDQARQSNLEFSQSMSQSINKSQVQQEQSVKNTPSIQVREDITIEKQQVNKQQKSEQKIQNNDQNEKPVEEKSVEDEMKEIQNKIAKDSVQKSALSASELNNTKVQSTDQQNKSISKIKVIPSCLIMPPASTQISSIAMVRVKNCHTEQIKLAFRAVPRSFSTSSANAMFPQLKPGADSFKVTPEECVLEPNSHIDLQIEFLPSSTEYILEGCKILISGDKKAWQVPVLAITGLPDISAHTDGKKEEIRLRNDGDGVAVIKAKEESVIIQPGGSAVVEYQDKFTVIHDGLRMLQEQEWAEMIDAMGMNGINEQIERLIELTCQTVSVE